MGRVISVVLFCLLAASCASKVINEQMTGLVGQPLDAAIAKLGLPTTEQTIAGRKVFVWFRDYVVEGTQRKCQIRVIMSGNVIGSFDFDGNEGQCLHYAALLRS